MRLLNNAIALSLWFVGTAMLGFSAGAAEQEQRGAFVAAAESDFQVDDQAINAFPLKLLEPVPPEFPEKRIRVRVQDAGGKKLLFPIYVIKDVKILDDRDPKAGSTISVSIFDVLNHTNMDESISEAMDRQVGKEKWRPVVPIGNSVGLNLWINSNGDDVVLASGQFSRATGQHLIKLSFKVDAAARSKLDVADVSRLGFTFSETYRGRFRKDNLNVTMTVASEHALKFRNQLSSDKKDQKAALLVMIGGGIDQKVAVQNYFGRQVAIDVRRREGSVANPDLIKYIIDKLFTGLYDDNFNLSKQSDELVVTFLFANGLKATATMGEFKNIKKELTKEKDNLEQKANSFSSSDASENEVDVSGNFSYLGIGGGGSNTVKWKKSSARASSENLKVQSHDFLSMANAINGTLPVAVMNAAQLQELASRANSILTINDSTFVSGQAALTFPLSFQAYAEWLEAHHSAGDRKLAEKRACEAARDDAFARITDAQAEKTKLMKRAATLVATMKKSCVEARGLRETEFYISGLRDAWRHLSAIGRWGKGEGDKFFAEWSAARDDPAKPMTRGEKFTMVGAQRPVLDAAFDSASKDTVDLIDAISKQDAIIAGAEKEIRKQQERIDTITKEIGMSIKN